MRVFITLKIETLVAVAVADAEREMKTLTSNRREKINYFLLL